MRNRFKSVLHLDAKSIESIKIDIKSRHELPQLLAGLQYIFVTPELNSSVFEILELSIYSKQNHTGRKGMSLWEILVMGVIRLNLDTDYDTLHDLVNNHITVRGILGVHTTAVFEQGKYYHLQTLKDNVKLLDESTLEQISTEVVKAGHKLKKKEIEQDEDIELKLKSDSYAVESNIHFPTDINLLWDSARKCIDTTSLIKSEMHLTGWRKVNVWQKKLKNTYRKTSNIHQKKGANYQERLQGSTKEYIGLCRKIDAKIEISLSEIKGSSSIKVMILEDQLRYYKRMLIKHIDLVNRRILQGEKIPHSEKIFSIFEPHVEWIQKGKAGNKVELGHNTLITTDQHHFIIDHLVMVGQTDSQQPITLLDRLLEKYSGGYSLKSISFDRGFYSKLSKEELSKKVSQVIMPSKGRPSKKTSKNRRTQLEKELSNKHCAVESNINELEHSGVNKVPDKGLTSFKKYVAMGVLAYNIKRLGRIVIQKNLVIKLKIKPKLGCAA